MMRTRVAEFPPIGHPKSAADPIDFTEIRTLLPVVPPNELKVCWVIVV
jgi:hypothetical protein